MFSLRCPSGSDSANGDRAWIDAPMPLHEEQNGPGELTLRRIRHGYRLHVAMQKGGWVVASETTWKGWRAYVDGHRVQMQIANLSFLAIYVPQGAHTIRLVYFPESFVIGRAISGLTLLGLVLFGFVSARRRVK